MNILVLPLWVPVSEPSEDLKVFSMTFKSRLKHVLESVRWLGWEASSLDKEQMISPWTPGNEVTSYPLKTGPK